jgi:hypothetical protein
MHDMLPFPQDERVSNQALGYGPYWTSAASESTGTDTSVD